MKLRVQCFIFLGYFSEELYARGMVTTFGSAGFWLCRSNGVSDPEGCWLHGTTSGDRVIEQEGWDKRSRDLPPQKHSLAGVGKTIAIVDSVCAYLSMFEDMHDEYRCRQSKYVSDEA